MKEYEKSPYLKERDELIERLKAFNLNYKWNKYSNEQLYKMFQNINIKEVDNDEEENKPTSYHCNNCNDSYIRDNPDLKYCEFCNEKLEE